MMAITNRHRRLANEADSLLGAGNSGRSCHQPASNDESPDPSRRSRYIFHAVRVASFFSTIYVLLIFVPLGILSRALGWHPVSISIFNFLAIIPLSALVSYSADRLSNYVGELVGGLIHATFGNAVELIVGTLALSHGETRFVQSAMLGSILSDILLVLGVCLFFAACGKQAPKFNKAMVDSLSSLMVITAAALILPTALYSTFSSSKSSKIGDKILTFSRASAIVLFILYAMYLYFQLGTHPHLFLNSPTDESVTTGERDSENAAEEQQVPALGLHSASIILITATLGIMVCTHYFIDSVDETAKALHITKTFIAAVLIPIASNAPEFASVVAASRSGKINFAIGVIVGSILQIGLFVIPFLVTLGWIIQQPMTLYFEMFQTSILFFAVLVVNRLIQEGKYTYIQGAMLVGLYAIIAIAFYTCPEVSEDTVRKRSVYMITTEV
ncbi:calcium/proton exchanger [Glonium stellatum]|uniref:Vacuolar calcium ion transporter n=1 Tax=Glonium stellatum TaxID=574774 RepID=A0A8E2EUK8_9PEZI|nr:calcium/proton exchanger [Glonium stellatum]